MVEMPVTEGFSDVSPQLRFFRAAASGEIHSAMLSSALFSSSMPVPEVA